MYLVNMWTAVSYFFEPICKSRETSNRLKRCFAIDKGCEIICLALKPRKMRKTIKWLAALLFILHNYFSKKTLIREGNTV